MTNEELIAERNEALDKCLSMEQEMGAIGQLPIEVRNILYMVAQEMHRAIMMYPVMASPHEGWAIVREEVDELWDEVKKKPSIRSVERMREEAIQIAAMSCRFVEDICK